ncbi:MAG: hypothetical protein MI867_25625 [Pseudomonadales bacterium]|nr:hypothetical protein [Pseudomonadales bacterium]
MKALVLWLLTFSILGCHLNPIAKSESNSLAKPAEVAFKLQPLQKRVSQQQPKQVMHTLLTQIIAKSDTLLVAEQQYEKGWSLPNIDTVLQYEQLLCELDKKHRNKRLEKLQARRSFANQFETLLLASCEPDFTPSVLARSLKQVRASRDWPESYSAYFDVQERHWAALMRLENLYGNLKQKMDNTIDKLTEIEVQTQP